jgi:transcriptional regulator with XRE-family HTH domain
VSAGGKRTTDADRAVAARVRQRRMMLGLTQQQFAERVGLAYQQAYKYETGTNRISIGRLVDIAAVLGTTAADLLADIGQAVKPTTNTEQRLLQLAMAFGELDEREQNAVLALVRGLARPRTYGEPGSS